VTPLPGAPAWKLFTKRPIYGRNVLSFRRRGAASVGHPRPAGSIDGRCPTTSPLRSIT
jgi:hypothetical protein